jgi:hypothetical protein
MRRSWIRAGLAGAVALASGPASAYARLFLKGGYAANFLYSRSPSIATSYAMGHGFVSGLSLDFLGPLLRGAVDVRYANKAVPYPFYTPNTMRLQQLEAAFQIKWYLAPGWYAGPGAYVGRGLGLVKVGTPSYSYARLSLSPFDYGGILQGEYRLEHVTLSASYEFSLHDRATWWSGKYYFQALMLQAAVRLW